MKLFGNPESGHAFKVKFFLDWAGLEHDYEFVDIFADRSTRSKEFMGASKFAEVPTLIDGSRSYIQSNAILLHLSRKASHLSDVEEEKCIEWLVWESNKIGMCLPQLRAHERFAKEHHKFKLSEGAYEWLYRRYNSDVNVLDKELVGKKFILGDRVSIADFSLSGYLMYANEANVTVPDNVVNWLDRLRDQKGWQSPYEMLIG